MVTTRVSEVLHQHAWYSLRRKIVLSMVRSLQLCALRLKSVKSSQNRGPSSYYNPNDKVHFPASMSPTWMRGSIIVHCSWEAPTSAESASALAKIYIARSSGLVIVACSLEALTSCLLSSNPCQHPTVVKHQHKLFMDAK